MGHTAGRRPAPGSWIVQFRACYAAEIVANAAGNQHLPIRQQRRRMIPASYGEVAGCGPHSGSRIV